MIKNTTPLKALLAAGLLLTACSKKINQQEDEIYSRHLQAHIRLHIISTPMPDDKSEMNLLLLNDGDEMEALKVKETVTALYNQQMIQPLLVVGISVKNKEEVFGVAGYPDYSNKGNKADKYADFIDNELYAFIKKRAGVRKFKAVIIAGTGSGGLSAFDIAWNHADKIDKVGVFSGTFGYSSKPPQQTGDSTGGNRIIFDYIQSSRKKPHLTYWLYGDDTGESGNRYTNSITANNTRQLAALIETKKVCPPGDIVVTDAKEGKQDYENWSKVFPDFLKWAVGR